MLFHQRIEYRDDNECEDSKSARERGIETTKVSNFNAIAGHGVEAKVDGKSLLFGNEKL